MIDFDFLHLPEFDHNPPPSQSELDFLAKLNFPSDFTSFYKRLNGGEGCIGESYIVLWKISELEKFNSEYEVNTYARGIYLFGSNGGGELVGFDTWEEKFDVVVIPAIGMSLKDCFVTSDCFHNFIRKLFRSGEGALFKQSL